MEHLIFRLYGPMASWGDIAVGERRPSGMRPSKSAIMGLIAAALGVRRHEEDAHTDLTQRYGIAVRLDAPGELLRDYHTTQTPGTEKGVVYHTRTEETSAQGLNTILSQRDYRTDAYCTVAVWVKSDNPPYPLSALMAALQRPKFVLYLGRKSCPPALPLQPRIAQTDTLKSAFEQMVFNDPVTDLFSNVPHVDYTWEDHPKPGFQPDMSYTRRDEVSSRRRWQFMERREYYTAVSGKEA